jgi:hypothetical protein
MAVEPVIRITRQTVSVFTRDGAASVPGGQVALEVGSQYIDGDRYHLSFRLPNGSSLMIHVPGGKADVERLRDRIRFLMSALEGGSPYRE